MVNLLLRLDCKESVSRGQNTTLCKGLVIKYGGGGGPAKSV